MIIILQPIENVPRSWQLSAQPISAQITPQKRQIVPQGPSPAVGYPQQKSNINSLDEHPWTRPGLFQCRHFPTAYSSLNNPEIQL